jgi:thermitase
MPAITTRTRLSSVFRNGHPTAGQLQTIAADIQLQGAAQAGIRLYFPLREDELFPAQELISLINGTRNTSEPHYLYLTNDTVSENTAANVVTPNDLLFSTYQWNLPAIETRAGLESVQRL